MASLFTNQINSAPKGFDFVAAHFACERDRFSADNPAGFVNFGSAQNYLIADLLAERLAGLGPQEGDNHYQSFAGTEACRSAVADWLASGDPSGRADVDADHVVIGNGIIHLLEALAIALVNPGEAVLTPTPVFPGLINALTLRAQATVEQLPLGSESGFLLTPTVFEESLQRGTADGRRIKAALLCSPGNPVGQVFDADALAAFVRLAEEHDCDLIVDEVYAGSCWGGDAFRGVLANRSDRLYVLGGLSKDFGLAGYATGWLQGRNAAVMRAVAKQAHFFRLPAPTQRVIERVLRPAGRDALVAENGRRLAAAAGQAKTELASMGVPVADAEAGLCLWLDLRDRIETPDADGEMRLYRRLLDQHRVHISPGAGFYCNEPGFFRLCFSQPHASLAEGLARLRRGLHETSPPRLSTASVAPETVTCPPAPAATEVVRS